MIKITKEQAIELLHNEFNKFVTLHDMLCTFGEFRDEYFNNTELDAFNGVEYTLICDIVALLDVLGNVPIREIDPGRRPEHFSRLIHIHDEWKGEFEVVNDKWELVR